jgi:8-oxo-dGTP diphosphatase
MNHRISAGMFVLKDERLLMVRHVRVGRYDFWVTPGGGVKGTETLEQTAVREVFEETNLVAVPEKLIYVEEFYSPDTRHCKFWFLGRLTGGTLDVTQPDAQAEYITEAAWLSQTDLQTRQVFPEFAADVFWQDRAAGFPAFRHMGLREMAFW